MQDGGRENAPVTFRSFSTLIRLLLMSMIIIYRINSTSRSEMLSHGELVHIDDTISINRCTKPSNVTSVRKKHFGARLSYYPNSESCFQLTRIGKSGDISPNPGPTVEKTSGKSSIRKVCTGCIKALRSNQNGVVCSGCSSAFHFKCSGMSRKDLSVYRSQGTWCCFTCSMPQFADSFFEDSIDMAGCSDSFTSSDESVLSPIDWFISNIIAHYKRNLKIGHLNVNSIYGKADEVTNLLNTCRFDIFFIAESKIDGSVSSSLFAHPEYRIIRRDRKKGAGGMLVYIRRSITALRRAKLEPEGVELICLDVKGCGNSWFLICACYRSPSKCKISEFLTSCVSAAEKMYSKRKEVMFLGDFNINMMTDNGSSTGSSFNLSNFCDQFCLSNTISSPTRVTASTKTYLDVILVSHPERFASSGTLRTGISDHDLIYIVRKQKLPKPIVRSIEYRSMKNFDQSAFVSALRHTPWDTAYAFDDVNDIWYHWESLLKQAIDDHAPIKGKKLKSNHLPWINQTI